MRFARGFLVVLWSERYAWSPQTELENDFRVILMGDPAQGR